MTFVHPILIGVAGGTGSGKTTVAQQILDRVGREQIVHIQHDQYYRDRSHVPFDQRAHMNFDHPNSLETELLITHLKDLREGRAVEVPQYDFSQHVRRKEARRLEPRPVILVEGILIFADPQLCKMFDIKIFVDTDADIRFIRRLRRDITERGRTMDSVMEQYVDTVRPMHLEFVEPSKRYADVIVPEGGFNQIAIDMIVARVNAALEPK